MGSNPILSVMDIVLEIAKRIRIIIHQEMTNNNPPGKTVDECWEYFAGPVQEISIKQARFALGLDERIDW